MLGYCRQKLQAEKDDRNPKFESLPDGKGIVETKRCNEKCVAQPPDLKMAFEKRKGNPYYYRKKRVGCRILSEYAGTGELAERRSELDRLRRQTRLIETRVELEERKEIEELDDKIDEIGSINRLLVDALFLVNGYRRHDRGEWRRKRNGKNGKTERQ